MPAAYSAAIASAMLIAGVALQALAQRLGITYQSLHASLNGNPTLERLQQIANALDADVTDLFTHEKSDIAGYIEIGGEIKKISSVADLEEILSKARGK